MVIKTSQENITNSEKSSYTIPKLPLDIDLENKIILKKSQLASRALAELKGLVISMPNQSILINTLSLQEAKDSSAIENIITTHDELYKSDTSTGEFTSIAAKEVHMYASALKNSFQEVKTTGLLTNNTIQSIQKDLEGNNAGFRSQAGTILKNQQTNEIVYTPPQDYNKILELMKNLESFINDNSLSDLDPLVKMAIIHHNFESVHPFFDGNGRTGRIICILYLVQQQLLDSPVLYLSRYINQNKAEYYRLLQAVRDNGVWEDWVLFILEGVQKTSYETIQLVKDIKKLMFEYKNKIRSELPKVYKQDLLNNIFSHPYTKVSFLEKDLNVHRNTARNHLNKLVKIGLLTPHKLGKEMFFINDRLFDLLYNVAS